MTGTAREVASTDVAIRADALTKRFVGRSRLFRRDSRADAITAVDAVNLTIRRGEVLGIVGPNGSGKTTLIKLLTTMLTPDAGSASVAGFDVLTEGSRVRATVGLVTANERSSYWRLTGRRNLEFFAGLYQIDPRVSRPWIEELIELLDLEAVIDRRFDGYSTGQKQRLALARGLLSKPQVLFMDEPTKGIDPVGVEEINAIIRDRVVGRWAPTILITSHDLSQVEKLCDRIALMHGGRIRLAGSLDELREAVIIDRRHHLRLRGIPPDAAEQICIDAGAATAVARKSAAGAVELTVAAGTGHGLGAIIRGLVEAGGDIESWDSAPASLDAIFHAVLGAGDDS